jgi:CBS domain-containing protein
MLKAQDIMTKDPITVYPDTEISQAAKLMLEHHINGVPVVDAQRKLVGILCQSDLIEQQRAIPIPSVFTVFEGFIPLTSMRHLEKEVEKITATTVSHAMTKNPITISPDTTIENIAKLMIEKKFHTLPVVDEGKLVGVVGKEDVLKTLISSKKPVA